MDTIHLNGTDSTPEMILDFENGTFLLKGESYPENVTKCYGEIFDSLQKHLDTLNNSCFNVTLELIYFNSSSVKIIMNLLEMLDECAGKGNDVSILWLYQEDDETIEEFGEEFSEDIEHAKFTIKAI